MEVDVDSTLGTLKTMGSGSRYQAEKIATIVGYLVIVVSSFVWGLSGSTDDNELCADGGLSELELIGVVTFGLSNTCDADWTGVRIVLNKVYLYKAEKIPGNGSVSLRSTDFSYYFYVPRAWGRERAETLDPTPKPGEFAAPTVPFEDVQVRTDQGRISLDYSKQNANVAAGLKAGG